MDVSPDAAYQRLLRELCRRLSLARAELQLSGSAGTPARTIVQGDTHPPASGAHTIELPIRAVSHETGRLRLVYASTSPKLNVGEQSRVQAMVELAIRDVQGQQLFEQAFMPTSCCPTSVTGEDLHRLVLDIHDGPVQKLFAASSHLSLLQALLDDMAPSVRASFEPPLVRAITLVENALQDIRITLSGLRMVEFQELSLFAVLHELALEHEALTGNHVAITTDGDIPPVSLAVKIALFRVMQESLSNAYRHAGVTMHSVWLSCRGGWIELEVADQGCGFEPPLEFVGRVPRETHIGLRGMQERIHLVGGQLRVLSQLGQGTRVIVQVPSGF